MIIGRTHPWCVSNCSRRGYRIPTLPLPCACSPGEGGDFPGIPQSPKVKVFLPAKILRSTSATWFTPEIKSPTVPYDLQFCIVAYSEISSGYKPDGVRRVCPGVLSRWRDGSVGR